MTPTCTPSNAAHQALEPSERLYELLIRDEPELDGRIADEQHHEDTILRLLIVSLVGTILYGLVVGLAAQFREPGSFFEAWLGAWPVATLPISLAGAFFCALFVCLPSFYFYTQLCGFDASFRLITAQALRVQGRTSVLLLGILPFYAALALAAAAGLLSATGWLVALGLSLPFVIGLFGLTSLYQSFRRLAATLPSGHRGRRNLLPAMVMAWGVVYSTVCPVALYRIGGFLGGLWGA